MNIFAFGGWTASLMLSRSAHFNSWSNDRRPRVCCGVLLCSLQFAAVMAGLFACATSYGYPGEGRVLSNEAQKEYEKKNFTKAAELFGKAAEIDKGNAINRYNQGAATYKAGKTDEAQQVLKSVYDQDNKYLNSAAEYNLGVIDHEKAEPIVKKALGLDQKGSAAVGTVPQGVAPGGGIASQPGAPSVNSSATAPAPGSSSTTQIPGRPAGGAMPGGGGAAPADPEAAKQEMQQAEKQLEDALKHYRSAILRQPGDTDMKFNYELAKNELDALRKRMQEMQPPPSQQNQKSDQQKKDQQQQNDKNQSGQSQDQQQKQAKQDKQDKNQQNKDQKNQQDKDKQNQNSKDQNKDQDQKDKQQANAKPKDQKDKNNDQKPEEGDQGQATPTPTPTPTPNPNGKPDQSKDKQKPDPQQTPQQGNGGGGNQDQQPAEEQPEPGQMSKNDVERLLNALPAEDGQALQKALNQRAAPSRDMDKDW